MTVSLVEKKISAIARVFNGNSVNEVEKKKTLAGVEEGLPYVSTKDVGFDTLIKYETGFRVPLQLQVNYKIAPPNSVLVCAEGGSAGRKIAHNDQSICFGNKLYAVVPNEEIDSKYLFYFFLSESFQRQFRSLKSGLIGGVSLAKFKTITLPVFPIDEQIKIVEKLDLLWEQIEDAIKCVDENKRHVDALFQRFLDKAVSGQLTSRSDHSGESVEVLLNEIGQARVAHLGEKKAAKVELNVEPQFNIPNDWRWVPLDSISLGINDGVHHTPKYQTSGVPFVTVKNLTAGPAIDFSDINYISDKDHQEYIKRTDPRYGDILISKDGTIGVVRRIETDVEFSIFVSVALVKPAITSISKYLTYALSSSSIQKQIVPKGAALKHLYLVDLRRLCIPLPPVGFQEKIVERLDAVKDEVDALSLTYAEKAEMLALLKKTLLQEAFKGDLL